MFNVDVPDKLPDQKLVELYHVDFGFRTIHVSEFEREVWLQRLDLEIERAQALKLMLEKAVLISSVET